MKPLLLAVFISLLSMGSPAKLIHCPKFCKCNFENDSLNAKCSSQKFLNKLDDMQARTFETLDLSNSSITTLDKRLKKLKNLNHLDVSNNELNNLKFFPNLPKLEKLSLANNKLRNISFSLLPKGLKDLDISSNFMEDIPKDWYTLHHLSYLHIEKNPVNCDESSINRYVNLVALKINITENVLCYSPKNLNGKNLHSLIADALLNPMLGDQEITTDKEEDVENEFMKLTPDTSEKTNNGLTEDLFEGSGEGEGSGDSDKVIPPACVIDCQPFKPLEILKENNTSPIQSIKEQVGILFEDLFGKEQEEPTTTSNPLAAVSSSTPVEEVYSKKTANPVMNEPKTTKNTEKLVNSTPNKNTDDLERASLGNKEDGYTYYLIGTVILLMVIVAIFILIKKKSSQRKPKRKRNSLNENGICEEMKPLGKYKDISNGTNNEKLKEDDLRPERIPLMNGQNGKSDVPSSQKGSLEDLDVTLRTPSENDSLSPKPERVTITASEIPPSVLKTPQLVHREVNSEGEIVTKPLHNSY